MGTRRREVIAVFFFFSNKAGLGLSLLISLGITLFLLAACGGLHAFGVR